MAHGDLQHRDGRARALQKVGRLGDVELRGRAVAEPGLGDLLALLLHPDVLTGEISAAAVTASRGSRLSLQLAFNATFGLTKSGPTKARRRW